MSKITQAKAIEIQKEIRVTVYSFDRETRRRVMTYAGLNPLAAINHITAELYKGNEVIITKFYDAGEVNPLSLVSTEFKSKQRLHYDEVKPYALKRLF